VAAVGVSALPLLAAQGDRDGGTVDTESSTEEVGKKRRRGGGRGNGSKQIDGNSAAADGPSPKRKKNDVVKIMTATAVVQTTAIRASARGRKAQTKTAPDTRSTKDLLAELRASGGSGSS